MGRICAQAVQSLHGKKIVTGSHRWSTADANAMQVYYLLSKVHEHSGTKSQLAEAKLTESQQASCLPGESAERAVKVAKGLQTISYTMYTLAERATARTH